MNDTFTALRVHRTDGKNQAKLENLTNDDLPSGNVLVDIHYSTINYKDALAVTGKAPIIRAVSYTHLTLPTIYSV